ncbi:uncharacterized protein LOC135948492 [Cloeon dipterum]|uniref:uncharacterized protein LOC135948492 n=1 Tax=Cloeon dipterum TaxID=197152 RepID=UPI00321F9E1C
MTIRILFIAALLIIYPANSQKNLCDPYWYSMYNPAVEQCRDIIRVMGRMTADTSLLLLSENGKLLTTDSPVEMILTLHQKFAECVLQADDKILPMDELFLQDKERVYEGNRFLAEIINLCRQTAETICPFHEVFKEEDRIPTNCMPHPLKLLKCIRQTGVPECQKQNNSNEGLRSREVRARKAKKIQHVFTKPKKF